jgi:hypothetical protein
MMWKDNDIPNTARAAKRFSKISSYNSCSVGFVPQVLPSDFAFSLRF